jgi:hypothetical protein
MEGMPRRSFELLPFDSLANLVQMPELVQLWRACSEGDPSAT